jgi:hypothetical protein
MGYGNCFNQAQKLTSEHTQQDATPNRAHAAGPSLSPDAWELFARPRIAALRTTSIISARSRHFSTLSPGLSITLVAGTL